MVMKQVKNMEYSISLQALFPFEIGIQALIQNLVLFDIQSCLVSRAYSFCLSKSSEINRFAGLYFLYSYLSFSSQNLHCGISAVAAKNEVVSLFYPEKWHSWKKNRMKYYESQLRNKKRNRFFPIRVSNRLGEWMDGWMDAKIFLLNTSTLVAWPLSSAGKWGNYNMEYFLLDALDRP